MDFSQLKVVGLKAELKKRGLPQTGLKTALIERLQAHEAELASQGQGAAQPQAQQYAPAPVGYVPIQQTTEASVVDQSRDFTHSQQQAPVVHDSRNISILNEPSVPQNGPSYPQSAYPSQPPIDPYQSGAVAHGVPQQYHSSPVLAPPQPQYTPSPSQPPPSDTQPTSGRSIQSLLNTADTAEDTKKRKRRSLTPPPSAEAVAAKKAKQDAERPVVHLPEDALEVKNGAPASSETPDTTMTDAEPKAPEAPTTAPTSVEPTQDSVPPIEIPPKADEPKQNISVDATNDLKPDDIIKEAPATESKTEQSAPAAIGDGKPQEAEDRQVESPRNTKVVEEAAPATERSPSPPKRVASTNKDTRFQSLFTGSGGKEDSATSAAKPDVTDELDQPTEPSVHPATPALYIRDIMRPLHSPQLRTHLISLATPPGTSPNPDMIINFHLDTVRTHALVRFTTIAAASRVRSSLHNRVWPDERTRKPLWVDFVPEDRIESWMETEAATAGGARSSSAAKRWEVVYETPQPDGEVVASLREVGSTRSAAPSGAGRGVQGAPLGPRSQQPVDGRAALIAAAAPNATAGTNSGFSALDTLFKSTAAKPKLYFLPVAKNLADKRLDALADETSNRRRPGAGGRRGDELRRYTFEDGDKIVDRGPDFGPPMGVGRDGGEGRGGYRGGYRGYRGGGYGGGGGGWRGRGGGGYGGPRGGGNWRESNWRDGRLDRR